MAGKKQTPKSEAKNDSLEAELEAQIEAQREPIVEKSVLLQKGGLWAGRTQSGEIYFSGYDGNLKLLIFKNKFKTEDKHPDYVMYVTKKPHDTSDAEEKDDIPF